MQVTFLHEPFIMHVLCSTKEAGAALLQVALQSGFRESGMIIGACVCACVDVGACGLPLTRGVCARWCHAGHKVMVAIRTTSMTIEAPVMATYGSAAPSAAAPEFVADPSTVAFLVARANVLFDANGKTTARFYDALRTTFPAPVAAAAAAAAAGSAETVTTPAGTAASCAVCGAAFPSKNKLFTHLKASPGCHVKRDDGAAAAAKSAPAES